MKSLSVPAAIVAGCGVLGVTTGLGLYFGLRARTAPSAAEQTAAVATITGATSRANAPVSAAAPTAAGGAPGAMTIDAAKGAIVAQHARLVEKCWNPAVARNPLPAQASFRFSAEYGEDGHLAMHSVKPDIASVRPDVGGCVFDALVIPVVSPPGHRVTLNVPIAFP